MLRLSLMATSAMTGVMLAMPVYAQTAPATPAPNSSPLPITLPPVSVEAAPADASRVDNLPNSPDITRYNMPQTQESAGRQQIEEWELKKYHQPGDKLEAGWNFDGMIEDAQLDMLSAWVVSQADAMPAWKPGDEFDKARKASGAQ